MPIAFVALVSLATALAPGAMAFAADTPATVETTTTVVGPAGTTVETTKTTGPAAPTTPANTTVETVETVEHNHHDEDRTTWFGVSFGAVTTPLRPDGHVSSGKRVTSNPFRACLDPGGERYCGAVRGFDVRLQMYRTKGAWDYPRVVGYFRTGYQAGHAAFDSAHGSRLQPGQATSLSYQSVPLFFGGSVYAFKKFPVRPYGGMGAGFDILRLRYARHDSRSLQDASARIGFELHAGIEARISNVVALSAEVTQLWSARRKLAGVPDFSNEGLTVMAAVAISIPSRKEIRRHHAHVHRRTTVRSEPKPETAAPVVPAPAPIIVAPAPVIVAPAPAPVIVAPTPAPVIVAPTPAPVIVAPTPAPTAAPPVVAPAPTAVAPG